MREANKAAGKRLKTLVYGVFLVQWFDISTLQLPAELFLIHSRTHLPQNTHKCLQITSRKEESRGASGRDSEGDGPCPQSLVLHPHRSRRHVPERPLSASAPAREPQLQLSEAAISDCASAEGRKGYF